MKWYAYVIIALLASSCGSSDEKEMECNEAIQRNVNAYITDIINYHKEMSITLVDEVNAMDRNMGTMKRKLELSKWHNDEAVRLTIKYGI